MLYEVITLSHPRPIAYFPKSSSSHSQKGILHGYVRSTAAPCAVRLTGTRVPRADRSHRPREMDGAAWIHSGGASYRRPPGRQLFV